MNIIGISAFGQNPAACLLRNGKLIAFAEEERFIRVKSAFGHFPLQALKYCLIQGKIGPNDIDQIAIGWDHEKYPLRFPLFLAQQWFKYGFLSHSDTTNRVFIELLTLQPKEVEKQVKFYLATLGYKGKLAKLNYVSHHLSHAASAYYASGFPHSLIFIADGSGEERTTSLYFGDGLNLKELTHANIPDSLGWLYAAATAFLGFKPYEDDGFVMGLAPYGKPNYAIKQKIQKIVQLKNGNYTIDPKYTLLGNHTLNEHFSDELVNLLGANRLSNQNMTQKLKNIAYALQDKLEEVVLSLIQKNINKVPSRNICLAGGVALNCKMNGRITSSGLVDNLFVQPASNDAGSALGAAMIIAARNGSDPRFIMNHTGWGPQYSEQEIKKVLDETMISYKRPKNIEKEIAKAIVGGKIVSRFTGRMEMGPRALGNRSILANACIKGMNDIVNKRVKHRDPWRPFCPSIIKETIKDYVSKPLESRFMTVIYDVLKSKKKQIPAVVHVDGTTRPQSVDKEVNPKYHRLISSVGEYTGNPVVLNTSFNVKGEPIVCTPQDALRCFASTGIDILAIEGFWIEKNNSFKK
jgi:carbamoyltransferase